MYKIYADGLLVHGPGVQAIEPRLRLEAGQAGRLDFALYENHPAYGYLKKLETIVTVYRDSTELFRGRVIQDELDMYNHQTVLCEGLLAIFNDTVLRPYQFSGSVSGYLQLILDQHNSQVEADKQVLLGNITVTDPNDYIVRSDTSYPSCWQAMQRKCVNLLGGYFFLRPSGGSLYLDYLADSTVHNTQVIRTGENLLDVQQVRNGAEIVTAILPLGARNEETDERIGIASVNSGLDYVFDADAVARYGWIMRPEFWDDVTVPAILKSKAQARLSELVGTISAVTVKAADLSMIDRSIDDFRLFEYVEIDSPRHGLQDEYLVLVQDLALDKPGGEMTVGKRTRSFTERQVSIADAIDVIRAEYATKDHQNALAISLANLNKSVANAAGLYVTELVGTDGAKRIYYHDKPTLEESLVIEYYPEPGSRVWTSTGWNGGTPVWQYGNDQHGLLVMRLISTVGLDAEWIRTGTLDASRITVSGNTLTQKLTDLADADATMNQQLMDYKAGGSNLVLNSDFGNAQAPSAQWWTVNSNTSWALVKARFDTWAELKARGVTWGGLKTYNW